MKAKQFGEKNFLPKDPKNFVNILKLQKELFKKNLKIKFSKKFIP